VFIQSCNWRHSYQQIFRNRYDEPGWRSIVHRMTAGAGSPLIVIRDDAHLRETPDHSSTGEVSLENADVVKEGVCFRSVSNPNRFRTQGFDTGQLLSAQNFPLHAFYAQTGAIQEQGRSADPSLRDATGRATDPLADPPLRIQRAVGFGTAPRL
jgi:hypothetical protein